MPQIDRFSVSLDTELLAAFDRHIAVKGYENRSEAIRDLIRDLLLTSRLQRGDEEVAAALSLIGDHRAGDAMKRIRACLVEHPENVLGSWQVALDADRDFLTIVLRGTVERVRAIADAIQALRGVSHGHLATVSWTE